MKKRRVRLYRLSSLLMATLLSFGLMVGCNKKPGESSVGGQTTTTGGGSTTEQTTTSETASSAETLPTDAEPTGNDPTRTKTTSREESRPSTTPSTNPSDPDKEGGSTSKDFLKPVSIKDINDAAEVVGKLGKPVTPSDVDMYELADDDGLIYNPLSREAQQNGTLHRYDKAKKRTGTISLGDVTLQYSLPERATAYDMIPISYTLTNRNYADATYPIHVTANAFEDSRSNGKAYYDLNSVGNVDVTFDYLGYVGGTMNEKNQPVLSYDFQDKQGAAYPPYDASELVRSGTVKSADILWFKFQYTNTGDTILDPDGNATFCFKAKLYSGDNQYLAELGNLSYRIFDYVYPGESGEIWVTFPDSYASLRSGDYKIVLEGYVRNETQPVSTGITSDGTCYTSSNFEFTVANEAKITTPKPLTKNKPAGPVRNAWLHYFEEFLSSYVSQLDMYQETESGVIYVQAAPWTEKLTLKLTRGNGAGLAKADIPITIKSDSIKIQFNPHNQNYVTKADGTRYPMIATQTMADMRSNKHRGPDAASTIINDLRDMQEAGINYLAGTSSFAYDMSAKPTVNNLDFTAQRFVMDVARAMGYTFETYSAYPFNRAPVYAKELTGRETPDPGDASALLAHYTLKRYGDMAYQNSKGKVLLSTEDTRGWLRIGLQVRYPISRTSLDSFRNWLTGLYGNVKVLNAAYGSKYDQIKSVNPVNDASSGDSTGGYVFSDIAKTYYDWSKAMMDYDIYRTVARANEYQNMVKKSGIDNASLTVRTEGWSWMVGGIDPNTANAHYRHSYFGQRRNATIAEIMKASGAVSIHSDYVTLPYTATEVAQLTKQGVQQGLIPMHLGEFNHMRDIAPNIKYGSLEYTTTLNTASITRGVNVDVMSSVFTWWKATYENGGIPGILWQDYLCDGLVTQTQFREMKFFKQKLDEAMNTAAGKAWAKSAPRQDSSWKKDVVGAWSFPEEYVVKQVAEVKRNCIFN